MADLHLATTPVKKHRDYTSDYASNETTPEKQSKTTKQLQQQPNGGAESKTNLIVNYLPQGMKTELLRELFATMGDIEHVKLCKNRESRVSLGFGFVKFRHEADAARAVKQLNGRCIQNKQIKVSYARPSSELIKNTNLYVSGLPKYFTRDDVEFYFAKFGKIISVRQLTCKDTGMSRGVSFVRFDTRFEADNAVRHGNKCIIVPGCEPITVKYANQSMERNKKDDNCWKQAASTLSSERNNDENRQFGRMSPYNNLMSNVQQRQIHQNRPITISVSNLPYAVTDRDIWALFGPFGAVTNVTVCTTTQPMPMSLSNMNKKKVATVVMPIYDEAIFAIMALNDKQRMFGDEMTTIKVNFKMTDEPIDHLNQLDC